MLSLNLAQSAVHDLEKIADYSLSNWGQKQSDDYLDEFEKAFHLLLDNPGLGKSRADIKPGYRSLPIEKHIIFYRIAEQSLEILRILHSSMDMPQHLTGALWNHERLYLKLSHLKSNSPQRFFKGGTQ